MSLSDYTDEEIEMLKKFETSGRFDFRYAMHLIEKTKKKDE